MVAHLQQTADSLGLPFGVERTKTYNSRLAQELGLWAEDQKKGDQFHKAAFLAYFVEGKNLAHHSVLLSIIRSIGLSEPQARDVLTNRTYTAQVDKDWADSRFKGVTAIPTFVMGNHKLIGAQTYETLEELVKSYNIHEKNIHLVNQQTHELR